MKEYRGYRLIRKYSRVQKAYTWHIYESSSLVNNAFPDITDAERWIDHRYVDRYGFNAR